MKSGRSKRACLDSEAFIAGLMVGPLLVVLVYYLRVKTRLRIGDDEAGIWLTLALPTAVLVLVAAGAALMNRKWSRWLTVAAGTAVGTAVLVIVVWAGISAIAYVLSDPVGM